MLKNDRIGCKFITICCMTTYKMKTFLLPLPPLNEQQRIVDEVSKIFGRIDKLNF